MQSIGRERAPDFIVGTVDALQNGVEADFVGGVSRVALSLPVDLRAFATVGPALVGTVDHI